MLLLLLLLFPVLDDLIIDIFKFICSIYSFIKGRWWDYSLSISHYDGIQAFQEFGDLFLLGVNQLGSISSEPLKLGDIFEDCYVALLELLELNGLLPLDMGRDVLVRELGLECLPSSFIGHGLIWFLNRLPPRVCKSLE